MVPHHLPCPATLIKRICAPIREWGLPSTEAASLAGIDPDLWPALCVRGTPLGLAVRKAESHFMLRILKLIFGLHIPGQPKVNVAQLRAMLERRFPGIWGRGSENPLSNRLLNTADALLKKQEFDEPFRWPDMEDDLPPTRIDMPPGDDVPALKASSASNLAPPPPHPRRETQNPYRIGARPGGG